MEIGVTVAKGDPGWYAYVESVVKEHDKDIQDLLKKYGAPEYMRPAGPPAEVAAPAPGESPTVDAIRDAGKFRAGVAIALPIIGQDPRTGEGIYFQQRFSGIS